MFCGLGGERTRFRKEKKEENKKKIKKKKKKKKTHRTQKWVGRDERVS